jgi:hypothetical protein
VDRLAFLTPQQRELLREAAIPVLLPRKVGDERIDAGAQTTTRGGIVTLAAFSARVASTVEAGPVEILTIPRERLTASLPLAERDEVTEATFMREYLEREAVSALAMRTLELAEGTAYKLTTPLDQLIATREAELPSPHPVEVRIDGTTASAARVVFSGHAATWADIPAQGTGVIVYASAATDVSELTACRA